MDTTIATRIKTLQSEKPVVSVVIPAYNEEKYLLSTIESLSHIKTHYPIEIILVDNGSTDCTQEIAESYWLKVVKEKQKWTSYARQTGLLSTRWDYIFTTDADSIVPSEWITKSMEYFEKNPRLVFISGPVEFQWAHWSFHLLKKIVWAGKYLMQIPETSSLIFGANSIFKKDTAINIGWYSSDVHLWEDKLIASKMKKYWDILIARDKTIQVITNGRRFSSFIRVCKYSIFRWPHEKTIDTIGTSTMKNMEDIR